MLRQICILDQYWRVLTLEVFPGKAPQLSLGNAYAAKLGRFTQTAPYFRFSTARSRAAALVSGGETTEQERLPQHLHLSEKAVARLEWF